MTLNVVGKIVAGFVLLGCIIVATNIVSYFGLANIRESASTVVDQKMPVQSQMLKVQTGILMLAKLSTNGYFEKERAKLNDNKQRFTALALSFSEDLAQLEQIINSENMAFVEGERSARAYIQQSNDMYGSRIEQLALNQRIQASATGILASADEAGALMLDLSYIESDDPLIEILIGTGLNIDNKITTVIKSTKEFITVADLKLSETIQGDIEFTLSNIEADSTYMNRLDESINTEGYVTRFNQEFAGLQAKFSASAGLFELQAQKITLISLAENQYQQSEQHLNVAINDFSEVFTSINNDTLAGQNAIIDSVQSNIIKGLVLLFFAIISVIAFGALAARIIAKPINRLNNSLSIISSGDLTHKVISKNDDEFALLADHVNKLTDSLHGVVSQIYHTETALEDATTQSARLGQQTLEQVESQKEQVNITAKETDSIRRASKQNTEQIQMGMSQLHKVSEQSIAVSNLVDITYKQISAQARQADQSATIIYQLEANSRKIGTILDVIKTIADQTNLLALNAAIEAARAGEEGRGFAVVADEVRTLAKRTQNSTEEIEGMIGTLQNDASQAAKAIRAGNEYAAQSEEQIQHVNQQMTEIGQTIDDLRAMNQEIVSVTLEQDSLFANVADNLANVVSLAEQSAHTTKESTDATKQLDHLMMALKQAVSKFKL
ncbi:MAG: methyl-accepting chemotaxis protein [Paraglaciecola sp.]|jgi:methyl-accepting chemotaxis protein